MIILCLDHPVLSEAIPHISRSQHWPPSVQSTTTPRLPAPLQIGSIPPSAQNYLLSGIKSTLVSVNVREVCSYACLYPHTTAINSQLSPNSSASFYSEIEHRRKVSNLLSALANVFTYPKQLNVNPPRTRLYEILPIPSPYHCFDHGPSDKFRSAQFRCLHCVFRQKKEEVTWVVALPMGFAGANYCW